MGVQSLQSFIEQNCPNACVPVDLLKIARSVCVGPRGSRAGHKGHSQQQQQRLCLVVDGECCLDRLYGGYFSDWVCGGQWNRMVQFLAVLIQTVQANHMELAVFFNGGLEPQRMPEWIARQLAERKKINQVLKHVEVKGTPPPKVWWVPPSCLSTCLRMALRHLNISVVCTMDDHHQEVIAYCRENNFHGLMAEDVEYAIFDPPRYFSSEQLKLTYKGSLETKEFILDEVAKGLDLHPNRFCVFAALLGNYLLNEEELAEFYKGLSPEVKGKVPLDVQIKAVCNFVRSLPSVDDLDAIGAHVFGPNVPKASEKIKKFINCVHYYLNGTKGGFLRYWPSNAARKQDSSAQYLPRVGGFAVTGSASSGQSSCGAGGIPLPVDAAKFASETTESELSSLSAYREATGSAVSAPQIVVEPPLQTQSDSERSDENSDTATTTPEARSPVTTNGTTALPSVSPTASGTSSPSNSTSNSLGTSRLQTQTRQLPLPVVPPEVMRTTSERQQKGLMSPWIYQVLTQGEIKIPVGLEEEVPSEFPSPMLLYRPVRQMVYAILFNLHHIQFQARQRQEQNKDVPAEKLPDIVVKEWVWTKNNQYNSPEEVHALPLGWAVPTVQRLWFGSTLDDKKRRLRAFLSCMGSDTPLMLNTAFVPQHLLIMCCVLRYILSRTEVRVLRRQELHAFLAQAVSPRLMDAQSMQSMQLPVITSRGVMLAALFMQGVETALFANDACGAPVPWLMCCPWLFFDGKLFHLKLLRANSDKTLLDICDGHVDQMAKVERIRQAILQGLKVEFARRPLPPMAPQSRPPPPHYPPHPCQLIPAGAHMAPHPPLGRPRGPPGRREMLARGGQLEIAGVVVGNWGPNYGSRGGGGGGGSGGGGGGGGSGHNTSGPGCGRGRGVHLAPQVTSVGGVRRFRPTYGSSPSYPAMGQARGYPTYGYRRPPPIRYRRPVTIQAYANKRIKKRPAWKKDGENEGSGGVGNAGSSVTARKSVESSCKVENDENVTITVSQLKKSARQQNGGIKDSAREHSSSSPTTVCRKQSASSTDSNAARNGPSAAAAPCPEDAPASVDANNGDIKKVVAVAKSSAALAVGAGESK